MSTVNKRLRGDVETIALKALEKERSRRYQSAAEFGQDIERYLDNQPILARPPSLIYQFRVFARRNKALCTAAAVVFVALTGATVVSTSMYLRAQRGGELARRERDKAEKFAELMEQTLKGVGPSVALGRDKTMLKELMDVAAKRIAEGELSAVPDAELGLRMTIGGVYNEIAQYDASNTILAPTVELAEGVLAASLQRYPGDHPEVAQSLANYAECLFLAGRRDEALASFEKSLAMRRRLFPGDHMQVAQSFSDVGVCLISLGRRSDAVPKLEESLAIRKRVFRGDHRDVVDTLLTLASCYDWLGRYSDALAKWDEALAMGQRLQPGDHPDTAVSLNMVGYGLLSLGRLHEALPKFQEALAMQRRLVPADNPMTSSFVHNVALTLDWLGRADEAVPLYTDSLAMAQRLRPGDSAEAALQMLNLAYGLGASGRTADALARFEESVAMYRRVLKPDDWRIQFGGVGLAYGLSRAGRHKDAEQLMLPAWEVMSRQAIAMPYKRRCLMTFVAVYESWELADPGKGYAEHSAKWREELDSLGRIRAKTGP